MYKCVCVYMRVYMGCVCMARCVCAYTAEDRYLDRRGPRTGGFPAWNYYRRRSLIIEVLCVHKFDSGRVTDFMTIKARKMHVRQEYNLKCGRDALARFSVRCVIAFLRPVGRVFIRVSCPVFTAQLFGALNPGASVIEYSYIPFKDFKISEGIATLASVGGGSCSNID